MSQTNWMKGVEEVGALISGHFVYASGLHGERYFNKDLLYCDAHHVAAMGHGLAESFQAIQTEHRVEVVVAPELGAILLGHQVAYWLQLKDGLRVQSVIAEKTRSVGPVFKLGRGYADKVKGKRVLVIEDVLTTGGSVCEVIKTVREAGGEVMGVGALCNRGKVTAESLDVPRLVSLIELELKTWDPQECPLCKDEIPVNTNVGKGAQFLEEQKPRRENPLIEPMRRLAKLNSDW